MAVGTTGVPRAGASLLKGANCPGVCRCAGQSRIWSSCPLSCMEDAKNLEYPAQSTLLPRKYTVSYVSVLTGSDQQQC